MRWIVSAPSLSLWIPLARALAAAWASSSASYRACASGSKSSWSCRGRAPRASEVRAWSARVLTMSAASACSTGTKSGELCSFWSSSPLAAANEDEDLAGPSTAMLTAAQLRPGAPGVGSTPTPHPAHGAASDSAKTPLHRGLL